MPRFTNFPHGITSLGIPTFGTGGLPLSGNYWFVNSATGADGNAGTGAQPFKTIARAVAVASAGDNILILGSFNEAVGVTKAGITFMGAGSTSNRSLWTAPDTTAPCLTVTGAADVVVCGIRFRPPVSNAAISLVGASNQFTLASSRIQGKTNSYTGILTDGGQANVRIVDNEFFYINTAATNGHAILGSGYATSEPTGWIIQRNKFHSNTYHIVCRQSRAVITDNVFSGIGLTAVPSAAAPSMGMDISGATVVAGGCNLVTNNLLGGAYSTALYVSGTNDDWIGNYSTANGSTCIQGLTIAVPAP